MPSSDPDDRLLAATRGQADNEVSSADEQLALDMAARIGRAARAAGPDPLAGEVPADLLGLVNLEDGEAPDAVSDDANTVVPLGQRSSGKLTWLVAAAAAVVLVLAGIALVALNDDREDLLAEVELEPLTEQGRGAARLVRTDGVLELAVDIEGIDAGDGYLEVWLLNSDVTELLSLGPVQADGTYRLPVGLDPASLPVVDVSIERFDGDPTHSGKSVVRGELEL